ncbi:dephospho-CoA kinase [filamentous cyanobacterium CCP5]|nr:dephospho-CoA kinase [filamentous cyanobacterium CCP5]
MGRIIGLTGGIATGKSTAADYLGQHHGLPVLDADIYAREAVGMESPILAAIADRYGNQILLPDGSLNRAALGEIIFNDPAEKGWLEQQIHPYVRQRFAEAMAELDAPLVVHAIPLLFEADLTDQVGEIWVVICSADQQLQRLMARNQLSQAQAQARIASQMSLEEKAARADRVLDNSGDRLHLYRQIDAALEVKP